MNIVEIIKKAPEDHVYWCTLFGSCRVSVNTDEEDTPIVVYGSEECELTEDGRLFPDAYDGECVLFPSKDNRDWADFESELDGFTTSISIEVKNKAKFIRSLLDLYGTVYEINLDHSYYKEHPFIYFLINGEKSRVSVEKIRELVLRDGEDLKEGSNDKC